MTEKKPPIMLLKAHFDVNQVGYNLEWRFSRKDHQGEPIEGKDAGSIYFTKGEQFFVQVSGGGKLRKDGKNPLSSFKILDCCLISQPQVAVCGPGVPTTFSPPSPFVAKGDISRPATISLDPDKFQPWIGGKQPPGYYQQTQAWTDHLTVGQVEGRWELSIVITVEFTTPEGVFVRVFGFDPESSVGTGINPP